MKKIIIIICITLFLSFPKITNAIATNSSDSSNLKIYIFSNENCRECNNAKEWLEVFKSDNNFSIEYINIIDNKKLNTKVRDVLNIKKDTSPLIVIGSNYFIGFNNNIKHDLENAIKSYEDAEDFCDIVSSVKNNENTKECFKQNEGIYKKSNISNIFYILLGTIICIILAISIVLIRKKRD